MKQLVLDISSGDTKVVEVPDPSVRLGGIVVKNHYSEFGFTKLSNNHPHLYSLHVQESNKLDSFIKDSNQEMMLN